MMTFGICGMIGELIVTQIHGYVDAFDWMEFGIWAVVAVCGAIRGAENVNITISYAWGVFADICHNVGNRLRRKDSGTREIHAGGAADSA